MACLPTNGSAPGGSKMNPFEFLPWYPEGATRTIGSGATNYIALYGDTGDQVIKYPLVPPDEPRIYDPKGQAYRDNIRKTAVHGLHVEGQILQTLGDHPRIVRLCAIHPEGLVLEYLPGDCIGRHLGGGGGGGGGRPLSLKTRLRWARQAAEAVAYCHSKHVLHCDITVANLLLDAQHNVKLCDWQGRLLSADGKTVLLDGGSSIGSAVASMPRDDENHHDVQTDLFALGTAIYCIVKGHLPFPDLDPIEDDEEIQRRFRQGALPSLDRRRAGEVVSACWQGRYVSGQDLVDDLRKLEEEEAEESEAEETKNR